MTEAQLFRRAREGNEDAFSQFFARHERAVFGAACMCGHECGDDIVQETFLALLQQNNRNDVPTVWDDQQMIYVGMPGRHPSEPR